MLPLGKNERIVFVEHKHWFVLFKETFWLDMVILLPVFVPIIYVIGLSNVSPIPGNTATLFIAFWELWFLAIWIIFFIIWTDWYLDVVVLTNKQLMHIEQKGFFSREISTLSIDKIQDITTEISGIVPTLLSYGEIRVQSAGKEREFVARGIARPNNVRRRILEIVSSLSA